MIFDYPEHRARRRHGPSGYRRYESFRPWLRDDFCFRCVYCLNREEWGQVTSDFELDHFDPQALAPQRKLDYANLVYACRRCNSVKGSRRINDPIVCLTSGTVTSVSDGTLLTNDPETKRMILQLDLNSPTLCRWRQRWLRIVQLAEQDDPELLLQLTGFPSILPNLRLLRPPRNTLPTGVDQSWHAKRERGELPDQY